MPVCDDEEEEAVVEEEVVASKGSQRSMRCAGVSAYKDLPYLKGLGFRFRV